MDYFFKQKSRKEIEEEIEEIEGIIRGMAHHVNQETDPNGHFTTGYKKLQKKLSDLKSQLEKMDKKGGKSRKQKKLRRKRRKTNKKH
jgi:regulator of replication initiation timing